MPPTSTPVDPPPSSSTLRTLTRISGISSSNSSLDNSSSHSSFPWILNNSSSLLLSNSSSLLLSNNSSLLPSNSNSLLLNSNSSLLLNSNSSLLLSNSLHSRGLSSSLPNSSPSRFLCPS